jgi:ABC-type Fe3+-siderophore transport system permease subunit
MDRLPAETESVFDVFKQAGKQVSHYLLWFFCFALGLGFIMLFHEILEVVLFLRVNPWHLRAYRLWSIFLLGMALIVSMFLIEGYLRRSRRDGRLLGASLTVLSVQVALIGIFAAALYFTDIRDFLLF